MNKKNQIFKFPIKNNGIFIGTESNIRKIIFYNNADSYKKENQSKLYLPYI